MNEQIVLTDTITSALGRPIDYSTDFDRKVKELSDALTPVFEGSRLSIDADMNYNAAQCLKAKCNLDGAPLEVRIYISSRGRLFCTYVIDLAHTYIPREKIRHPLAVDLYPESLRHLIIKIGDACARLGYMEVDQTYWPLAARGNETQLDGLPATVFQALFAEII